MKRIFMFSTVLLFTLTYMIGQTTVTGTVSDAADGDPLEGVAVVVKGTTIGVFSDEDGKYSLTVPAESNVLLYTYVGKLTQEIALEGRTSIDVSMAPDYLELDEVVVTAVGLESNRRSLGYSIQNVDADDIVSSRETNIVNALNSKVAGVTVVSSSGSPGSSANIRIRGSVSVNGSNSPLFVVDGVPIDNSESGNGTAGVDQSNRAIDVNPNDIESVSVLKGAAATALYGIRAANGAVIITTKSGKAGKPRISVSASYTLDRINKMPARQSAYAQGRPDGGAPLYRGPETFEGFSWGPALADMEYDGATDYPFDVNGALVPAGTGNGMAANAYDPYDFFVDGATLDLNASVSGGNDKTTYYLSAGRLTSTGVVPTATFNRNTFKVKAGTKITKKLTAEMSANFINSGGNRIQRGSNLSGIMLGLMRTTPSFDNGNNGAGSADPTNKASFELANGEQRSYRYGVYDNPYWTINKNPFRDDVNRVIGYGMLKYEATDWLTFSYKLGTDFYTDRRNGAFDINPGWSVGEIYNSFQSSNDLNSDFLIQINKNFGSKINFNSIVGHNYYSTKVITQSSTGTTLAAPDFYHISNATDIQSGETIGQRELVGVFGTINLSYDNYLFLNFSARNDWSSTLGANSNSIFYPSASLGFSFTEALGMSGNPILPYGKIRASLGQVGNDAPFVYATANYFGSAFSGGDGFISGISYPAFGTNAFELSSALGNSDLRPETTTTLELGAELKFFTGRIGLDFTYYNSTTTDVVVQVDLPSPTGFTSVVQNAGVISNTGWEVILNAVPVRTGNFEWSLDVNFTTYENTVDSLGVGISQISLAGFTSTSSRVVVGEAYGALFGSGFQKDDAGNMIIGADGWPLQDAQTQVYGDPNPDWIAGIRNTFSYKGLSISALLDIRQGGDMWCGTCGVIDYFGTSEQSGELRDQTVVFEGVTEDGAANTTEVSYADPANGLGGNYFIRYGFGGITEMSVYDTSWLRLREVTVNYALPASITNAMNTGDIILSLSGRNLWLSTEYPGIDPETNLTGGSNGIGLDYFNMPNTKSFGGSIRVNF